MVNARTEIPRGKKPGLRILVVEDYLDAAQCMGILLRLFGHEVQLAADGPTALDKARQQPPDVVLLDIGLPGMNGYKVAEQLAALGGKQRPYLIAITGFGQEKDRHRSQEVGINLHLVKPVDPVELEQILGSLQAARAG